jgi:hypothetical protein
MREVITVSGQHLGWIEPFYKMRRVYRAHMAPSTRPVYFAILPNGERTSFTLPSRKQAIEWLTQAQSRPHV